MRQVSLSDEAPAPDLLAAALAFRDRRMFALPLSDGKRPLLRGWPHSPWPQRRAVFASGRAKGIGVQCGMKRGDTGLSLVSLDFDDLASYEAWRESGPEARRLASTAPTVATSRGRHVYLQVPGDVRSWYANDGPIQCEGKAAGTYVVAPPSIHPSGAPYRWVVPIDGRETPIVLDLNALPGFGSPKQPQSVSNGLCDFFHRGARSEGSDNTWTHKLAGSAFVDMEGFGESLAPPSKLPEWIGETIRLHIPDGPGTRNNTLFQLALALVKAGATPASLKPMAGPIIAAWFPLALPLARTKDPNVSLGDFLRGLNYLEARLPGRGEGYEFPDPDVVASLAAANPYETGDRNATRDRIAAIFRAFAYSHEWRPFALDGRTLAKMAGVSKTPAMRHVKALVDAGFIEIVDRGQGGKDSASRRSARYRWRGRPSAETPDEAPF